MKHCPSPEQLTRLLAEQLSAAECETLDQHLADCVACQNRLAELSSGENLRHWRACLQSDAGQSPQEFLQRLREKPPSTPDPLETLRHVPFEASPDQQVGGWPVLPGYEVLGELGRGGAGVVYKARQVSLDRLVALKVLRVGALAGPDELARFFQEAEAVARLRHPHLVQIHEVSRGGDLPFLALEYVEGGSLARHLNGTPQPARPAAEIVDLLARAVHHAHQCGIIHRDLKPANVLLSTLPTEMTAPTPGLAVAGFGLPKVTDFGMAKRIEGGASLTETGSVLGTPSYMAPEQAQGQGRHVGRAADVYALGAILYELLTGRPPFRAETPFDTLMQVVHQDPLPPRQLQPKIPRDLETICLKCLHKDPGQRYPNALALAEDVNRFLSCKPIQARPVGALGHAWRWSRRNPLSAGLLGALAVGVLGLLVSGWLLWQAYRGEREARMEEKAARLLSEANEQRAEEAWERAVRVLEELSLQFLDGQLLQRKVLTGDERAYLERMLADFEGLTREGGEKPRHRQALARAWYRIGLIQMRLDRAPEAEAAYREALARGDVATQAEVQGALAYLFLQSGQLEQGRQAGTDALGLFDTLPEEARQSSWLTLARCYNLRGTILNELRRPLESLADQRKALEIRQSAYQQAPHDQVRQNELGGSFLHLGRVYDSLGRLEEAQASFDQALTTYAKLRKDYPFDVDYLDRFAIIQTNRGALLRRRKLLDEASAAWTEAESIHKGLATAFPGKIGYRISLAGVLCNLGNAAKDHNKFSDAEQFYNRSIEILEPIVTSAGAPPDARPFLCNASMGRARLYHNQKQAAKALADWDRALAVDDGSWRWTIGRWRCMSLGNLGRHEEVFGVLKELIATGTSAEALVDLAEYSTRVAHALRDHPVYKERAVQCLQRAAKMGCFSKPGRAQKLEAAVFDPLRNLPDFQRLVAANGGKKESTTLPLNP